MGPNTRVVVKLSGSLFFSSDFDRMVETLSRIAVGEKNTRLVLVCGGGRAARDYIDAGRKLGLDHASLDGLGIQVSRLNAAALAYALGNLACQEVAESLEEIAASVQLSERVTPKLFFVVTGGLQPGQSTNAVGALAAEKIGASHFFNATDVDGVYDRDPDRFPDATKLGSVTPGRLSSILRSESLTPGGYDLMDPVALKVIERSRLPTTILKCEPLILEDSITGKRRHGTRIEFG